VPELSKVLNEFASKANDIPDRNYKLDNLLQLIFPIKYFVGHVKTWMRIGGKLLISRNFTKIN